MADKKFPVSQLPIRKSENFLPQTFQTENNKKFLSGVVDPLIQPGVVEKTTGYIGKRYGKTFSGNDIYLDDDETLRSKYQLEPGVVVDKDQKIKKFWDYLDLKNILNYFGNYNERDDKVTDQEHYSWNPPIDWDKFVNYREYYWAPSGPPSVAIQGQASTVVSTYKVKTGIGSTWVLTPDGFTNNPNITLFRGQTYVFDVNSPKEGFTVRTNYDTGSILYNTEKIYFPGELAVFDGKLWRAKVEISPADGSTIDIDSQDWELLDSSASLQSLLYNDGIENNGVKVGKLTFTVPQNAPDILYYQSDIDPNRLGQFIIADIDSNTFIDVQKDIIGKKNYKSSNNIEFTNGMTVEFTGTVIPEQYASDRWLVEGVGDQIKLKRFSDLVPPSVTANTPEILFDNEGFDTQPFDDATQYPGSKDYITINRSSRDSNPWSRYNRWFHRSVLEYAYKSRGEDFPAEEAHRAKRPIIEFSPDIKLFNHGTVAKQTVDYIDDFTTDVFSTVEGSTGYNIDGEFLFQGARVLVTADNDSLANNKIYVVNFITHNGRRQINLRESNDTLSVLDECVLIRRGEKNAGKMFHYNGTNWVRSQEKLSVNQEPLFDGFDENGISFDDGDTYPVSTFAGNKIFSYKVGNSINDTELGFSLSYLNIENVGDIVFNWNWDIDSFNYTINQQENTVRVNSGYYKINNEYANGWIKTDNTYIQPIVQTVVVENETSEVEFTAVSWSSITETAKIIFYRNGKKLANTYTRIAGRFIFDDVIFSKGDAIVIKIVDDVVPDRGYYEIPVGLEKNPLNNNLTEFTLGQASDHVGTSLEFNDEFKGSLPGSSNLRDLKDYEVHAKRFLKHSGISAKAIALLCDKENNIIKSLQYAKKQYSIFKDNFIKKATELPFNNNINDFVDEIIADLTRTKSINSPFADSDMIGSGAFTPLDYVVEDTGIKTFTLSSNFDLETLSRKAVYVYLNGRQLLNGAEYYFDSNFGFVTLTAELAEGDRIQIREYVSTSYNHIPPTPSSMGLYKKYTPMKFLDDTYKESRQVIQGHDGSIQLAYDDFRDDLLLELEYRIYNNIKKQYSEEVFDIDATLGGYYSNAIFTKKEFDNVAIQEFLKWVANTNLAYTTNDYFVENETFTYTYSNMTDPTGTQNLPGWWRGVYKWFYDTDRPHRCPWECLGFSEKPTWWEEEYGPAPYTSGNLILWEDIRDGIIRQGDRAGRYDRYARTSIISHIPVNADGELLSPLDSGLAGNFVLINNRGSFLLGDISPVEYAWRASSEGPFGAIIALCLLRPFEFIITNFNKDQVKRNRINQIVNKSTNVFLSSSDLELPIAGESQSVGLSSYISSYIKSQGRSISDAQEMLTNIDVKLSSRLSGFVDKEQQKYLLDSKNPNSSSSSIFIPSENYDIVFNVSTPIASVTYSGVIFEKTDRGWIVSGYDDVNPYFNYVPVVPNQKDPVIEVGGVTENFTQWEENKTYSNGAIIQYRNDYYRANKSHTGTDQFDSSNWSKLAKLPSIGAVTAQRRRNFNQFSQRQLSYGTTLNSVQEVVDFLLGYQEYLKTQGFVFENYDPQNSVVQDFVTAAKEFMFWTRNAWAPGALLTVSPGADKMEINIPVGVADNLLDNFYDYNVLRSDGQPLNNENISVTRDFQSFKISTTNTNQGIYYLKVNYVLKEHISIFDDKTVFNDILFDKTTGYRQERIKTQGFRTVDWDGDYTSPGFLFDNVNIEFWVPFTDYRLGDIVSYKQYNYTSVRNHAGTETFQEDNWTRLDSEPSKQLIPNYDYRINQMEDYFDVASSGLGKSQRDLARHTVGYQQREYLQALAEDQVTQFQLYQGFIREKGTNNSLTKLFNKIGRAGNASVELSEEWAFKVGQLGGVDQSSAIELKLNTDSFKINPQPIIAEHEIGETTDRYYRVTQDDFPVAPIPYTTNIIPVDNKNIPTATAGYVKIGQTEITVRNRSDILDLDIFQVNENDHIWITFEGPSWTVLRANTYYELPFAQITDDQNNITVTFNKRHNLAVGDLLGIKDIDQLDGFHEITEVTPLTVKFVVDENLTNFSFEGSTIRYPILLSQARFDEYKNIDPTTFALLSQGSKLFVDKNSDDRWEVVEKKKQYTVKKITDYGLSAPIGTGYKVAYSDTLKQVFASIPTSGVVVVYIETTTGLGVKQILQPETALQTIAEGSFGKEIAISSDNRWAIVGTPNAGGVLSRYKGIYQPTNNYILGDIVLYESQLWKANKNILGDGSTINVYTEDWDIATNIEADSEGSSLGYANQGMITIYEYGAQQWNLVKTFLSPRPNENQLFGSKIAISKNGDDYRLAVSAPGANNETGTVYLFNYNSTDGWTHDVNQNYKGLFDASAFYPKGSIVWFGGNLWQALADNDGDGSSITDLSNDWVRLNPVSTRSSLPQSIALEDDGSTLEANLVGTEQISELVQNGDKFGSSVAMNYDGSVLVIGAPFSEGQYFSNYRGLWKPDVEYVEGDVVKYQNGYHRLDDRRIKNSVDFSEGFTYTIKELGTTDWNAVAGTIGLTYAPGDVVVAIGNGFAGTGIAIETTDSTARSYNEKPDEGFPWNNVGDSTSPITGKVFVYRKDANNLYKLDQTITAETLNDISDLDPRETISTGDQFGHAIAIDYTGNTLIVSSPKADVNYQNQGSVYLFELDTDSSVDQFRLRQKLESYDRYPNEFFGQSVFITPNTEKVIVGANNSPFTSPTIFDNSQTTFDNGRSSFISYGGYAGSVYVFERKQDRYLLAEKLEDDLSPNESFGWSVSCSADKVIVGSPDYIAPALHGVDLAFEGDKIGQVRMFSKALGINSLEVLESQPDSVAIDLVKRIALYSNDTDNKIQDIEILDPAKLKILATAEKEIEYKTPYDPAIYSVGTDDAVVDSSISWKEKNVGKLWWNISNAKWLDYEQGSTSYRLANWGRLATGATIDIYEWVESKLLPSEWSAIADTNEGLPLGISGQPLYPEDTVYSIKELYNSNTGQLTETRYYYWVKNKVNVPNNSSRTISASSVASLIENPQSLGNTFIALASSNQFFFYNYKSIVSEDNTILNIEFYNGRDQLNPIHNEYQLLTEGSAGDVPALKLENKMIDSLIGFDKQGNRVPDPDLPEKQQYGVLYRPRQSMFIERKKILKTVVTNINKILEKEPFANSINFQTLNLFDEQPSANLNLYDAEVDTFIDLETVGTVRVRVAKVSANIIDGAINSMDIIDPGFGYRVAPTIEFEGNGVGAVATTRIDNQGRVIGVTIVNEGKKYTFVQSKVRNFSVLVKTDSTAQNYWSIYAWDDVRKTFFRSASQSFDTRRYWSYANWWLEGYGDTTIINKEILSIYQEPTIVTDVGDLIRIREYGSGGWAVLEKIIDTPDFSTAYKLVGRENGTIQLSQGLYDTDISGIGYDNVKSFDTGFYDREVAIELRNILKAVKEDIFIGDYTAEWNKLFFTCVRFVFKEQTYVDWAFKTSFLNAVHNVGELQQPVNYRNDSLESYLDYINEVKPYRTTVREYVSKYNKIENANSAVSDFDLPPVYSDVEGSIITVNENNEIISTYPYRYWLDNKGYSIVSINVSNEGSGYTSPPKVIIEGNASKTAVAKAYISNGKVSAVRILDKGKGYITLPTVTLVGGNGSNTDIAKASAVLGDGLARTFDVGVKFDRLSKEGLYNNFNYTQTFTATGGTATFELAYAPTNDKSKISITINEQLVLPDAYKTSFYTTSTDDFKILKGKIIFNDAPIVGDIIKVTYDKNDELLDSVNRIEKYYNPSSGMKGRDLNQLMTGIDFGGVQVQGTTFDVTGGWDALPWFTDSWDSVEAASDYYVVVDGSTTFITLPYIPADGQILNIYLKRAGNAIPPTIDQLQYSEQTPEPPIVRIDDPNYTDAWDSSVATNPNAQMPTFVGDGSTNTIELGEYIGLNSGDVIIVRPQESDGSVTITDPNIIDSQISGGSLSAMSGAYATATGLAAEDIKIDGGVFVDKDQVPAPEENVPGQILDSLSIKVFHSTSSGAAPIQSKVLVGDDSTATYSIGQKVIESKNVIVYVDGIKKEQGTANDEYFVDIINSTITLNTTPSAGSKIEIISIGIGGVAILDYQEFIADGETSFFLTNANFADSSTIFATIDGVETDAGFVNSTDIVDTTDRTLVQFGTVPAKDKIIKIIVMGTAEDVDSTSIPIVRINQQSLLFDGSSRLLDLDNFVNLTRANAASAVIVEVDGVKLKGVDTTFAIYDGTTNKFILGVDPEEAPGAILTSNIEVYVNDVQQEFINDYVYNGTTKELEIVAPLTTGDEIKIINDLRSEYTVSGNSLTIKGSVSMTEGSTIDVTWFSEYPSMGIVTDRFTGGKVNYKLPFAPLATSYVWVYKNGIRLISDIDYSVSLPRGVVYLTDATTESDIITITIYGTDVFRLPVGYEVSKDMLNVYHFNRFNYNNEVRLSTNLNYYDQSITVTNASTLAVPLPERNVPGAVMINNERIEYLEKNGNVLSKLRRGTQGTAIKETHSANDLVVDVSIAEQLPYTESQERLDYVSDGSSLLIGPLNFVPSQTEDPNWYSETIPSEFNRCDTIEVFAGGKRLRKTSLTVFDETLGATSPAGDKQLEAEFAVDGVNPYVRLSQSLPAGTRITIIKRVGNTWYDRGTNTATSGVTLLDNATPISQFIAAKSTGLPE